MTKDNPLKNISFKTSLQWPILLSVSNQLVKPDYLHVIPPTDTAPQFLENLPLISFSYFIFWLAVLI